MVNIGERRINAWETGGLVRRGRDGRVIEGWGIGDIRRDDEGCDEGAGVFLVKQGKV